jgi:hypothetical protein
MTHPLLSASPCAPCLPAMRLAGRKHEGVAISGVGAAAAVLEEVETSMGIPPAVLLARRSDLDDPCAPNGRGGDDTEDRNVLLPGWSSGGVTGASGATVQIAVDGPTVMK